MKIKVVLAGTPEFAVPIFEEVINNFDVVAIISQPDRPANRGYSLKPTPTKLLAQKYNIKLFQPEKIADIYEELSRLDFDFLLTAAFGQFIPTKVLNLAKVGAMNIHGSLLPKYRGAAPIQHAVWNNEKETGISFMYMVKTMDAGDVVATAKVPIDPLDTSKEVFIKLTNLGANNISQWLKDLYQNKLTRIVQDEALVTFAPKLEKKDAQFYSNDLIEPTINKIRAFNDNPGAFILINDKRLKVFRATTQPIKNGLALQLQDGVIYCYEYQFEGRKKIIIPWKPLKN